MRLPQWMPIRTIEDGQPIFVGHRDVGALHPQFDFPFPIPIPGVDRCATACLPKAGFAACYARCKVDGCVCDGGVSNCSC
jgi:hypothetical protein